jgi:hypothetical protein
MTHQDDPLLDEALDVADRRASASSSTSEGLRLIDRLVRIFGARSSDVPEPESQSLFAWGTLEIKRALGAGSFGEVFAAWDSTLQREVALKLRVPEVGALRWLEEARNLARIRHPHVITVYGADVLEGRAGIWTELVSGRTLEEEMQESGPFAHAEALRIGREIASALSAVHAAGLVHGDVKASNIMLEAGNAPRRAVLVDFGTADEMLEDGEIPAYLAGTPLTMAPEVLDGKPATGASDVYGLGATLFRLLTGRDPVEAQSIDQLRRAHAAGKRPNLRARAPDVPPRLTRAIERALDVDPAQRWSSAQAFQRELDDIADPTRRVRARAAAVGAGAAGLAAVIVLAILIARPGPGPIARGRLSTPSDPGMLHEAWRRAAQSGATGGYGYRVATLDMDGDGFDELATTESRWRSDRGTLGRVMIFHGSARGLDSLATNALVSSDPDSNMGTEIASAGDVNGDGFEDLLVTEETIKERVGRVFLYLGGARGKPMIPAWTVEGLSFDSGVGRSMTAAGDVNGDGFGDVVIGELRAADPLAEEGVDRLYLGSARGLSTSPAWTTRGGQERMELGSWMNGHGDVNGDGHDDVLLGAGLYDGVAGVESGVARLFFGNEHGAGDAPAWSREGAGPNFYFGCYTCFAGDVNGDGFDDILVSERQFSDEKRPERGRVLVFDGGKNGPAREPSWTALGPVPYSLYGFYAQGLGDVDGDGFDDIAIGAPQYTEGKTKHSGLIEVYRGGRNGLESSAAWRVVGDREDAHMGHGVFTGDFNGDHVPDLVALAALWGGSVPEQGLLITYLGQAQRR